tara:strand:+ start:330 stop:731 length:402 start_codon:yes stop_codon:yes gene_type:complete
MKDKEAELIWEALQQVDKKDVVQEARPYIDWSKHGKEECPKCGEVHPINASCGVAHEADVKESDGEWASNIAAMRKEIDEYLTTSVHTTGAEDLKDYVLAIIDRYALPVDTIADVPTSTGRVKRMFGKDNQAP